MMAPVVAAKNDGISQKREASVKGVNSAWGLWDFQNFLAQKSLSQALACDQSTASTEVSRLPEITRNSSREAFWVVRGFFLGNGIQFILRHRPRN